MLSSLEIPDPYKKAEFSSKCSKILKIRFLLSFVKKFPINSGTKLLLMVKFML